MNYQYNYKFRKSGSALRASSRSNPRNQPCPTCGEDNRLTLSDVRKGYQCDKCADMEEFGMGSNY